ncbi:MAG TPA: DUF1573 domain-containing protein [Gemmataceae bacterium]|jgi:hypothetical protein|nr:DUF1573 domain-containing protein [Gemmataceae bacterium]
MLRNTLILLAGLWLAAPASAGSWADAMFDDLSKDFGSVPRGPAVAHPFRLTNNTGQQLHIRGVRVSCGCTTASAEETDIAPGKSTVVNASMDTRRFIGHKAVTVYVTFDQPQWAEVRLLVQADGRDDINVSPEAFALGQARRGSKPRGSINVTFYGNTDAQITGVERESNYILAAVRETRRDGGEVSYEVIASIRNDCPVGKWYSDLWLKTNNPSMPRVRLPLTVEIQSPLTVSGGTVALGSVKAGTKAEKKIIVRGATPFKITKVQGTDDQLTVKDNTDGSKEVHVLTVTFRPTKLGDLDRKLKVITDLKDEGEVEFETTAKVEK